MVTKVARPAIKTSSGKVVPAPQLGLQHKDIDAEGQRGFLLSNGKFANRGEAAKVAKAAGQVTGVQSLHSHHLPEYKAKHRGKSK